MSGTVYQRLLPSSYSDGNVMNNFVLTANYLLMNKYIKGIGEFRLSAVTNASLPSPRLISSAVANSESLPNYDFTQFVMQWGQWLERDLSFQSTQVASK